MALKAGSGRRGDGSLALDHKYSMFVQFRIFGADSWPLIDLGGEDAKV